MANNQYTEESRNVTDDGKRMNISVYHRGNGIYVILAYRQILDDNIVTYSVPEDLYSRTTVSRGTRFSKKNLEAILKEHITMFDDPDFIEFAKGFTR